VRSCSNLWKEQECTLQKAVTERSQRSASALDTHGELAEQQMVLKARARGIRTLIRSTRGIKTYGVYEPRLQRRHQYQTICGAGDGTRGAGGPNFVGHPLTLEAYSEKLKPIADSGSKKPRRHLSVGAH